MGGKEKEKNLCGSNVSRPGGEKDICKKCPV